MTQSTFSSEKIEDLIKNPWDNVYWFARWLIDTDRYGAPGRNSELMLTIASSVKQMLQELKNDKEELAVETLSQLIRGVILNDRNTETSRYKQLEAFCDYIHEKFYTVKDVEVFVLACEKILVPINKSLEIIPNDDRVFAEAFISAILSTKKEAGLKIVISKWDELGLYGCLSAERIEVVDSFSTLQKSLKENFSQNESNIILTSFVQEFERRLSQKRKGRAGRSLEDVTSFILKFFGIDASLVPVHITASLELDRLVNCRDGKVIGISCKRTLRERWKQAFTSDITLLEKNNIKALWHAITFDRDLSDEKIEEIGKHRGVIYLPDDSPRYQAILENKKIKKYVRPLTKFIEDLKREIS